MLTLFLSMGVLIFSSLIYTFEHDDPEQVHNPYHVGHIGQSLCLSILQCEYFAYFGATTSLHLQSHSAEHVSTAFRNIWFS